MEQGCFPAAVGTDQADSLLVVQDQVDPVKDRFLLCGISKGEVFQFDDRVREHTVLSKPEFKRDHRPCEDDDKSEKKDLA